MQAPEDQFYSILVLVESINSSIYSTPHGPSYQPAERRFWPYAAYTDIDMAKTYRLMNVQM
jgi:hypothetical protein